MSGMFSLLFYIFIFAALFGGGLFGGGKGKSSEKLYGQGDKKIAVVDISGIILEEDPGGGFGIGGGGAATSRGLIKTFENIKEDKDVAALVLRVNSPGGSVTASEEIYQMVKRFKKETGLPVIVSQGDTAASGGYYVSLAGDAIVADATTLTGSIGAIIQSVNFSELAGKLGVEGVVIASGKNKDLLNPFEEVKGEHVRILKNIVDEAREQFVDRILEARKIERSKLEPIADGRVLSGKQAKEEGLIDRIGNFNDSVELAKERAGLKEASVVEFGKKGLLESLIGAVGRRFSLIANTPFGYLEFLGARPAYLYLP
jgi:protease-4